MSDKKTATEKSYMFQFADAGWSCSGYSCGDTKIFEDTGLITESDALELWEKNLTKFKELYEENHRPEMCIWQDCKSNIDYHTTMKHVVHDDDLEFDGNDVYIKTTTTNLV